MMNRHFSCWRGQDNRFRPEKACLYARTAFVTAIMIALVARSSLRAAQVKQLTMAEAVSLALKQNRMVKIARFQVQENREKKANAKSLYFPTLKNESNFLHSTELQNIDIPAASFGTIPGVAVLPPHDIIIDQGRRTLVASSTSLVQPLTQLLRIRQENKVAQAEVATSQSEVKKAELEVTLKVHEMYYALLVAQLNRQAAQQQIEYAEQELRESVDDVKNGAALRVAEIGSRAGLLESKQSLLTVEVQIDDSTTQFNDLLGLPLDTKLKLDPAVKTDVLLPAKDQCLRMAWAQNPEIRSAEETVRKASAGVSAARTKFIPDVTTFARYSYQNGVPFLVHNFGTVGVNLSYDIFDFGRRRAEVRQDEVQLREAEENLERLKDEVAVQVEQTYNKLQRTKNMVKVAQQMVELRAESERLASNQFRHGVVLVSERRKAGAEAYKAQADLLQANLAYVLAHAELDRTIGVASQF
jgi:outer membrane protein TolC